MTSYLVNLVLLLMLVAAMAVSSLWLWKRLQSGQGLGGVAGFRPMAIVQSLPLGLNAKIITLSFEGRNLLLSASKSGVQLLHVGELSSRDPEATALATPQEANPNTILAKLPVTFAELFRKITAAYRPAPEQPPEQAPEKAVRRKATSRPRAATRKAGQ